MPRVLMLPGYTQNAHIMSGRMGAIRKALPASVCELVFVDPVSTLRYNHTQAHSAAQANQRRADPCRRHADDQRRRLRLDGDG